MKQLTMIFFLTWFCLLSTAAFAQESNNADLEGAPLEEAEVLEPPYSRAPSQNKLEPPYSKAKPSIIAPYADQPIPKPTKINEDSGTYYYGDKKSSEAVYYQIDDLPPTSATIFARFGTMGPYDISNDTGQNFKQLYEDNASLAAYFEYEWALGSLFGRWYIKAGTGISATEGVGRFLNGTTPGTPREEFFFIVFPNTALLNYKLKFSDKQLIVPYVEFGGGYMGFIEYRDDGERTSFGGAPFLAGTAGLLIDLNIVDRNASGILLEDYGIHKIWFDLQFRRNLGLDDTKDVSSNMITAGFGFAY